MFKNIINIFKTIKKEKDKCCSEISKSIEKFNSDMNIYFVAEEKKSKIKHYTNLLELVKKYEEMNEIVTIEDIKIAKQNRFSSNNSINPKPRHRKLLIQKKIDELSSNPTTKELEDVLNYIKENIK